MSELKADYGGQTPQTDELSEVDDIIQTASRIIQSIRDTAGLSPPRTRVHRRTVCAPLRERWLDSERSTSNLSSNLALNDVITISDMTIQQPLTEEQDHNSNMFESPSGIDESEDDVIIVSSNLVDVVDLCTPVPKTSSLRRRRILNSRLNTNNLAITPERSVTTRPNSSRSLTLDIHSSSTNIKQPQQQRQLHLSKPASSVMETSVSSERNTNSSSMNERSILMCPVCMESVMKRKPTSTKCGHVFCETCINQAIQLTHKCPMCKTKLNNRMLFRIYI